MEGIYPRIDRIFTSLLSLGRVEKAGEVERSFQDGRREVHKSRLEALQNVCHPCTFEFVAKRREREREASNNPLRARIESTYVCTRPRRGQASFAERPRVPPTFPS